MSAAPDLVIDLRDLHRTYGRGDAPVHALRGIDLQIRRGEFVAIMGASGSGKSTLMNIIGCLDRATRGSYSLDGVNVSALDSDALAALRNHKLGFVFQGFNLLSRTTAQENVELPMLYAHPALPGAEIRRRAQAALERIGLAQRAHHSPSQLSGGQQQRVAIARALVLEPAVLLADEPTGNLDYRTSIEIMGVFQQLNRAGVTIVMVTHELDVARYTRRTVVLRDGRVVADLPVTHPLDASTELAALCRAEAEAQLGHASAA